MPPTLDNTIGAAFVGSVFAAALYGVTNIQVYSYYTTHRKDYLLNKFSVALLWILDSLHLSLTIMAMYHYLIESFGLHIELEIVHWSYKLQIVVNIVIVVFVHTLYAIRVWKLECLLSKSSNVATSRDQNLLGRPVGWNLSFILFVLVCFVIVVGYATGIALAIKTFSIHRFVDIESISWIIIASFACSTLIDFILSTAMCYYLTSTKTSLSKINNKIITITRLTFASGCLTSACSLVCLVCFVLMPDNLIFLGVEFLLTKLYVNSFLAMLNARDSSTRPVQSLPIGTAACAGSARLSVRIDKFNMGSRDGPASVPSRSFLHHQAFSHEGIPLSPLKQCPPFSHPDKESD